MQKVGPKKSARFAHEIMSPPSKPSHVPPCCSERGWEGTEEGGREGKEGKGQMGSWREMTEGRDGRVCVSWSCTACVLGVCVS